MLVDSEKVVLALKAKLRERAREGKRSWGSNELLELLADLEVEHRVPEGQEGFDDQPRIKPSGSSSLAEPVAAVASGAT